MNQLLELSPLIVFFVVFKLKGIYWATGSLMLVCTLVMLVHRFRTGSFKPMHVITVAILLVLGSATIFLHDKRFIQMKPTVLLALTAAVFLGSTVIGKQPLARRMLEGVFEEPIEVSPCTWQLLNIVWAVWFALLAAANLYVARNFDEDVWVKFKVFGIGAALVVFMIPQVLWLSSKLRRVESEAAPP
jgi:intracellular septation protein